MRNRTIVAMLAAALTLSACGDTTAPVKDIELTDAQVSDMMDALSAIGAFDTGIMRTSAYRAGTPTALLTSPVDETVNCPNGGSTRTQGSVTMNDAMTQISAAVTQSYSACKATSSSNTVWTFNGAPNIKVNFSMTFNEATGAYTMTGTEVGALDISSTAGSGRCNINVSMSFSGNDNTGAHSGSVTGSVCGHTVNETM